MFNVLSIVGPNKNTIERKSSLSLSHCTILQLKKSFVKMKAIKTNWRRKNIFVKPLQVKWM